MPYAAPIANGERNHGGTSIQLSILMQAPEIFASLYNHPMNEAIAENIGMTLIPGSMSDPLFTVQIAYLVYRFYRPSLADITRLIETRLELIGSDCAKSCFSSALRSTRIHLFKWSPTEVIQKVGSSRSAGTHKCSWQEPKKDTNEVWIYPAAQLEYYFSRYLNERLKGYWVIGAHSTLEQAAQVLTHEIWHVCWHCIMKCPRDLNLTAKCAHDMFSWAPPIHSIGADIQDEINSALTEKCECCNCFDKRFDETGCEKRSL